MAHPGPADAPWQPNTKFVLLGLDDCLTVDFHQPVILRDGISVHSRNPLTTIPDHWRTWLGTLTIDQLEAANLILMVQRPSATPDVLDAETLELEQELTALWYGLLLHGVPDYRAGLIVTGGVCNDGDITVRSVAKIALAYRHRFGARPNINATVLASAAIIATSLANLQRQREYRRVRLGFKACVRGLEERVPEERLHQFVRAADGLMHLPRQGGEEEFKRRGQTFVHGARLPYVLEQLYRMRNAQEHLNDFRDALGINDHRQLLILGSLRAYQAEQLTMSAYRRLLSSPLLLERFRDDGAVDAFWAAPVPGRQAAWGPTFDLDQAEQDHDRLMGIIGLDD